MLNIRIICVGKLKERYWQDACAEYMKRLGAYCRPEVIEVPEEKLPANASAKDEQRVIEAESAEILKRIGGAGAGGGAGKARTSAAVGRDYVIVLDVKGKELSSEDLADNLSKISLAHSSVVFIIGGSLGLGEELKARADLRMSFGRITLPHQLARVVALEQIYRAFKINAGETYHK